MTLVLHGFPLSACTHRVRLLLSLLHVPYEFRLVDLAKGEHLRDDYRKLNPLAQVPLLEVDGELIRDSHAILIYLARRFGDGTWLPEEPLQQAWVLQWLFYDDNDVFNGVGLARNNVSFGVPLDLVATQRRARHALAVAEQRLTESDWLALDRPTLADVSCCTLLSVIDEAGLAAADYPAIARWLDRLAQLPDFMSMPRLPARRAASADTH